jgi:DNA-binding response OmpR family regulator
MSGYTGETILARGVREEGVGYLQKPFTPATLAHRVREVLDEASRPRQAS